MHARLVLQWLAGELDAVPLWNAGRSGPPSRGSGRARNAAPISKPLITGHLLACTRHPWPDETGSAEAWMAFGWAFGARQTSRVGMR